MPNQLFSINETESVVWIDWRPGNVRFELIFDAAQQEHVRAEHVLGMLGWKIGMRPLNGKGCTTNFAVILHFNFNSQEHRQILSTKQRLVVESASSLGFLWL